MDYIHNENMRAYLLITFYWYWRYVESIYCEIQKCF